jgi:hypothetical protein
LHKDGKIFKWHCNLCGQSFIRLTDLTLHKKRTHGRKAHSM